MDVPDLTFDRPGLVIVDMQNDFVRVGAPLEVPSSRATIDVQAALLAWFRARRLPVVFTKVLSPEAPSLITNWNTVTKEPIFCCRRGHVRSYSDVGPRECTDVIDELRPSEGEYQVEKYGYNAFHRTNLSAILESEAVDTIFITGTVTNICVEDTARGAMHEGFKAVIVSDGVSSTDEELHRATLRNFHNKFGWVMPASEAEALLGAWLANQPTAKATR